MSHPGEPGPASGPATARLEAAKVATSVVFFLNGWSFATWAGRIPSARDGLGLTPGQLSWLLLVHACGALVGLPLAGRVAGRIGAARTVVLGSVLAVAGFVFAGAAITVWGSTVLTGLGLFVFGVGMGQWDVAMNLEGAGVERLLGRTIMPRYHAGFSLGTVAGAAASSGLSYLQVPLLTHFIGSGVLVLAGIGPATRRFLPHDARRMDAAPGSNEQAVGPDDQAVGPDDQAVATTEFAPTDASPGAAAIPPPGLGRAGQPGRRSAWTERRTILIGLFTLVAGFTEGAANDWLSVAFIDGYHLPEWAGVLGYAVFLTTMTLGRVLGSPLLDRFGRIPTIRVLVVMAAAGSLCVVFGTAPMAFVGAAVWGIGISLGFPLGMSAAADEPERAHERVSVVATIAYTAFVAGPPLLGFIGDRVGVLRALTLVSALLLLAWVTLPALAKPSGNAADGR